MVRDKLMGLSLEEASTGFSLRTTAGSSFVRSQMRASVKAGFAFSTFAMCLHSNANLRGFPKASQLGAREPDPSRPERERLPESAEPD